MNKLLFQIALISLPVSGFCQDSSADSIVCNCTEYSEGNDSKAYTTQFNVSLEELNTIPPLSETWVNYLSDYELEKDTSGRVSKLIRTTQFQGVEEITYIYDMNNRLIEETIHFDNRNSGEDHFYYRDEKIYYTYNDLGRRVKKTRKLIDGLNIERVLEECSYTY